MAFFRRHFNSLFRESSGNDHLSRSYARVSGNNANVVSKIDAQGNVKLGILKMSGANLSAKKPSIVGPGGSMNNSNPESMQDDISRDHDIRAKTVIGVENKDGHKS